MEKVERPFQVWDYENASMVYAYSTLDGALDGVLHEIEANGVEIARTWFLQRDDGDEIAIIAEEEGLVALARKRRLSAV